MQIKQGLIGAIVLALAGVTHATTWYAGSQHVGQVNAGIAGGAMVRWHCDGQQCQMSGPWGAGLSMQSCQNLVAQVGSIQDYRNSAGQRWKSGSAELAQCNQVARIAKTNTGMTTWYAASPYQGTVIAGIAGGVQVEWQCNGHECSMSGPWGAELSLQSCQQLVRKVGKITRYSNSAGRQWNHHSAELKACNAVAP